MVTETKTGSRWLIAAMGTVLMLCLGTVYAWSFFQGLLVREFKDVFGWSNTQVAWIFSLAIFCLGLTAAWGGVQLPKRNPRALAMIGALLFAAGYAVAAFAFSIKSLVLLYAGYGVIGGIGLGLGYVTPVATVAKWFPDRKGLATGMVVMGFGLGALFMSKVLAPLFLELAGRNLVTVFLCLSGVFLVLGLASAAFMRNPPAGWQPPGFTPPVKSTVAASGSELPARRAVFSGRFFSLWIVFFCNITAGISIISFQSPLFQDLWKRLTPDLAAATLAAYGATLVAISSLFNGGGRFLWGVVSDRIGRSQTFRVMLGSEIVVFALLVITRNPWVFAVLVCWILMCYGGGFGTMPSFIGDVFGARLMSAVYGAVLTTWAVAGIVGPQIFAVFQDALSSSDASFWSFIVAGGFAILGLVLSFRLSNKPMEAEKQR
ncbi:MAG: OFA family MFS transporter [Spirochaetia bacterium]|jgi:OFA family oxalate/formate antiporter-like MFS transporter